jgi:hypothetical protein
VEGGAVSKGERRGVGGEEEGGGGKGEKVAKD